LRIIVSARDVVREGLGGCEPYGFARACDHGGKVQRLRKLRREPMRATAAQTIQR